MWGPRLDPLGSGGHRPVMVLWRQLSRFGFGLMLLASAPMMSTGASAQERVETGSNDRDKRLAETYRQMLSEDPGQEYAFRRLLETAHALGGLSGLIALYQEDVSKNPKAYASWLVLGQLQRAADQDEAFASWEKAAALKADKAEPHLFAAAFHRQRRAWVEAFTAYDRGVELLRDRGLKQEALRAAAEAAIEAKDLERARVYFERLIKTEPNNVFLRMQEASTWSRLDQTTLALERWREVEKQAGGQLQHLVIIWREMAELEAQLGRFAEAEATWRRGLAKLAAGHYERRTFLEGLVSVHRRQDRLGSLVAELERESERDADALVVLARVLEELGQDEAALARFREAQKRRPGDEDLRMSALRLLERIGKPEDVLNAWVELVRAFPREPRYELRLVELYFQQAKPKEAGELLKRVSRAHPQDPSVHLQVVDLWMRYGDKATRGEVEATYKLLMKLEPEEPSHVMSLGEYYWSIEDKARALATWQRLQKMGAKRGEGRFLYAEALADHDLFAEALSELLAALELAPDNERYVRSLALLYERMGRRPDALSAWQRLLERSATSTRTSATTREAREHIIELWEKDERLEAEMSGLMRRFGAEPPDMAAGRFLAVALLRTGRVSEARAVFERLDELVPNDHETLSGLDQVYTRQGDTPRLMDTLERLAKASPRAALEYLFRAAELALSQGDDTTAKKLARQLIELAPAEATAHIRVGELYARLGLSAEAAESWRQALSLEPRNMSVRFRLASLYRDQGLNQREEQVLTEIVRETSDPSEVTRAGRRLLQVAILTGRLEAVEQSLRPLIEAVSRPESRGRTTQLKLVLDVYGHLAQSIRFGPLDGQEAKLTALGERAQRPIVQALEDSDIGMRTRALELVELTHPGAATGALGRLASDPEQSAHLEALAALGRLGTSGAVQVLTRLTSSPQAPTRELALWALGRTSSAQAGQVLVERARRGPPRERLIATLALGFGRHEGVGEALVELARDPLSDVREAGLWAVTRHALPEHAPILIARLEKVASPREAAIVVRGLARLGALGAIETRDALVAGLWTGNPNLSEALIWEGLAELGLGTDTVDPTEEASTEAHYRALVMWERGIINPARPQLYLGEPRASAPRAAALPPVPTASIDERLVASIAGRIIAVLERGHDASRQSLFLAMSQDAPDLETTFGRALRRALNTSWSPLLTTAEDIDLRAVVWSGLVPWLGALNPPPEALSRLAAAARSGLLDPRNPELSRAALTLMAALAGKVAATPDDLDRMARHLALDRSLHAEVRAAAARALAAWSGASQIAPALEDPSPLVRIAAATAIRDHALPLSEAGLEGLVDLTRDPLPEVGVAAAAALLAQPNGVPGLPGKLQRRLDGAPPHIARALSSPRATAP